ncbi:MAG: c-type cytochrome [Bacteroidia bacterium]|nr:c-type cytochrome [Bacteroidia bacterium]MCC6769148.1 c-type cytochrome [Bacteroidia bacterium]
MRNLSKRFISLLAVFLTVSFISSNLYSQDAAKLFKANCAACHKTSDKRSTGPGLLNVKSRWPDQAKLISWVKNAPEFLKTGDAYANNLFKEFNQIPMPPQSLTEAEITAIIDWCDKGGDEAAPVAKAPEAGAPAGAAAAQTSESSGSTPYILVGLCIILLFLIAALGQVRAAQQALLNERAGIPVPEKADRSLWGNFCHWTSNNKKLVAVASFLIFIWILKITWDALLGIGVYQGYAPEQPIKFSHKLHAGDNKIDCQYCHTGVEKSRHAVIPSANVCMNCHKYVQEGPEHGTKEIAKIYAALDFNPETQQYGPNPKPIQWIRVHSLPDHAYFNHSQHVKVGKIECKECHGAVDSMTVVSQFSPLTMGWCVNCHRETEVDFKNNGYYEELHKQFVNDPKYKKGDKFTIGSIGGLECAKCHY